MDTVTCERFCLRCNKDLGDAMGCYVFVSGRSAPDNLLFCVECGNNGANGISVTETRELVQAARRAGRRIQPFSLTITHNF